ncbi:MAG: hypothetical protein KAW14_06710 [Candidatus Aegiribacteria sp.]|nr:hypothetical protein [Candidatus Aegiribacteria sp.]
MKLLRVLPVILLSIFCGEIPVSPGFPPPPCVLNYEAVEDSSGVVLTWTVSEEGSFREYELYRGSFYEIPLNPDDAVLLASISDINDTLYIDMDINWVDTTYYCVKNVDTENQFNWSNILQVRLLDSLETLTCYEIQGQQDESPYSEQVVAITGIVTCASKVLPNGFTIVSDYPGGAWSGLVIMNSMIDYSRGDSLLIIGEVEEMYDMTLIKRPMTVELIRSNCQLPVSFPVSTSDLSSANNPEQWEGVLVEISKAVVSTTTGSGFFADDGTGQCVIGDQSGYSYYPNSMDTLNITGIALQDYYYWTLEPRNIDDLSISYAGIGGGSAVTWRSCAEIQGPSSTSPFDGEWVTVFGVASTASNDYPGMTGYCYGIPETFTCAFLVDPFNGIRHGLLLEWDPDQSWSLQRGDNVLITGYCSEDCHGNADYWTNGWGPPGNTTVSVVHLTCLGSAIPCPAAATGNENNVTSEDYEGVLTAINDVVVIDILASHKIVVSYDQGNRSCLVHDYPFSADIGDTIQQIKGIVWYNNWYECFILRPRDANDIIL